ncbi:MAG: hypothetical protein ABJF01_24500 [bacterium]
MISIVDPDAINGMLRPTIYRAAGKPINTSEPREPFESARAGDPADARDGSRRVRDLPNSAVRVG